MKNIPPKIQNLSLLEELGIDVPFFIFINSVDILDIKNEIKKIIEKFKEHNVESVIIRSASFSEDLQDKSMAGFFESSKEILLKDLDADKVVYFWNKNKKKADDNNLGDFFIFIQEFFNADYSGVLFTEDIYDKNFSVINLSLKKHAITDGLSVDKKITFDKKNKKWNDNGFLDNKVKLLLEDIIKKTSKKFLSGADIELGITGDRVKFYQVRPITRNTSEKILLNEKTRLKDKFKIEFDNQSWGKNGFVQAMGDLTPLSLSFYNYLLNSDELRKVLKESRVVNSFNDDQFYFLENIGGRTYFNFTEEKRAFNKKGGWWDNFKRTVLVLSHEKMMQKMSHAALNRKKTIEESFSWFFLSGIYLQFFLEQERKKYKYDEFIGRLKNTEKECGAGEPRPESLNDDGISRFISRYYYLSDYPYELSSGSICDHSKKDIIKKYKKLKILDNQKKDLLLNKRVQFWLKNKVLWKEDFLKLVFDKKSELIKKYGNDIFYFNDWESVGSEKVYIDSMDLGKISNNYLNISGKNYPFCISDNSEEVIIVPGIIDFTNLIHFVDGDKIENYFGKYLAVDIFLPEWIPFIAEFSGIVLREGNELSHISITCREYNIPCVIKPDIFEK